MSIAKTEDYGWDAEAPESSDYLTPVVLKLLATGSPRNVLDAGCGNGALCGSMAAAGYTVTGMDGDAGGIEHARMRYPGIPFAVGDFGKPPADAVDVPDGGFDAVVSTEVVEHLYAPHDFARYCFEALRPGGLLVVSTPYHGYLKNLVLSVTNKWDHHHTPLWHGGHIKFWSAGTLGTLLEQAGFRMTGFAGAGRLPYLWKSMVLTAVKPAAA